MFLEASEIVDSFQHATEETWAEGNVFMICWDASLITNK